MAKTQIYDQGQALPAYFNDMLTTPAPATKTTATESAAIPTPADNVIAKAETSIDTTEVVERPESLRLLLCDINDIKLALPVSALNNIVHWPEQGLNILPEQTDWQLGSLAQQQQNSQIIDLCRLLQPQTQPLPLHANYILLIAERRWGIACQHIQQIVSYESSAINWHDEQAQTPWFKGVTIEGNYQIIDVSALIARLEQS